MPSTNQFLLLLQRRFAPYFATRALGFFIVPLHALVLFMVAAAAFGAVALQSGMTIPQLLLVTGILNAFVALYIYSLVPEFLLRFLAWLLVTFIYRLRTRDLDRIPEEGPALTSAITWASPMH